MHIEIGSNLFWALVLVALLSTCSFIQCALPDSSAESFAASEITSTPGSNPRATRAVNPESVEVNDERSKS